MSNDTPLSILRILYRTIKNGKLDTEQGQRILRRVEKCIQVYTTSYKARKKLVEQYGKEDVKISPSPEFIQALESSKHFEYP